MGRNGGTALIPQLHRDFCQLPQALGEESALLSPFPHSPVHVFGVAHPNALGTMLLGGLGHLFKDDLKVGLVDHPGGRGEEFGGVADSQAGAGIPQVDG